MSTHAIIGLPSVSRVDPLSDFEPISVAAAGTVAILARQKEDIEIYEVYLWAVAANTVQLRWGSRRTGIFDFDVRQGTVIVGLWLQAGTELNLVTGGAGLVVGHIRFRRSRAPTPFLEDQVEKQIT